MLLLFYFCVRWIDIDLDHIMVWRIVLCCLRDFFSSTEVLGSLKSAQNDNAIVYHPTGVHALCTARDLIESLRC